MIAFSATLTTTPALAGNLAPSLAFAADLTVGSANYVDFTGNLGSPSSYGKLAYGQKHYSLGGPFAPTFAGNLDIVGQDFFAGDLAPVITFSGNLAVDEAWGGDLAPIVTFSATLTIPAYIDFTGNLTPVVTLGAALSVDYVLAGDLPPQVTFNAALALDLAFEASLEGAFAFTVVYDALSMISGPLWGDTAPCPTPPWGPSEPCPPSLWTPTEPCDPVEWEETELCNG